MEEDDGWAQPVCVAFAFRLSSFVFHISFRSYLLLHRTPSLPVLPATFNQMIRDSRATKNLLLEGNFPNYNMRDENSSFPCENIVSDIFYIVMNAYVPSYSSTFTPFSLYIVHIWINIVKIVWMTNFDRSIMEFLFFVFSYEWAMHFLFILSTFDQTMVRMHTLEFSGVIFNELIGISSIGLNFNQFIRIFESLLHQCGNLIIISNPCGFRQE